MRPAISHYPTVKDGANSTKEAVTQRGVCAVPLILVLPCRKFFPEDQEDGPPEEPTILTMPKR